MSYESKVITAENSYTEELYVPADSHVNVSIFNTSSGIGTVRLYRKHIESGAIYNDVDSWVRAADSIGTEEITTNAEPEDVYYKVGVATGDYTSGTITVRIGCTEGA